MNSHKRNQNSSKGYGQLSKSQNCSKLAKLDRYVQWLLPPPTLTLLPLHRTHITLLRLPTLAEAQMLRRLPTRAWPYIMLLSFAPHILPLTADLPLTTALPLRRGPTHVRLRITLLRLPSCAPSLTPALLPHRDTLIPPLNRRFVADCRFSRRLCSFVARHTLDSRFFSSDFLILSFSYFFNFYEVWPIERIYNSQETTINNKIKL